MGKTFRNSSEDFDEESFKKTKIKSEQNKKIKRIMKSHKGQCAFLDMENIFED